MKVMPKMMDDLNLIFKVHSFLHFFFSFKKKLSTSCMSETVLSNGRFRAGGGVQSRGTHSFSWVPPTTPLLITRYPVCAYDEAGQGETEGIGLWVQAGWG